MNVFGLAYYGTWAATTRVRLGQYQEPLRQFGISLEVRSLLGDWYWARRKNESSARALASPRLMGAVIRRVLDGLEARRFDKVVLTREILPFAPATLERALLSTPFIYDLDDASYLLYRSKGPTPRLPFLAHKIDGLIRGAETVLAGSEALAAYTRGLNGVTKVLPSVVDTERYRVAPQSSKDHIVIGWIGSPATAHYLDALANPLAASYAAPIGMRVTHVINGLGVGGAERALLRLVQDTSTEIAHHIIALTCVDGLRAEFEQVPNVRVRAIGAPRGLVGAASVVACTRYIAASEPQVIHGWLKQSCAVACLAATAVPSLRRVPLVCGVRDTVGSAGASASERVALSVGRILSPRCDMLLSNSTAALDQLIGVGYRPRRSEVLHNGVDVPPDVELREARQRERARLGIADADSVALFVGSLHPAKDPGCLLRAVERMRAQMPRLVVLRAGRGPYEGEATPDALKLLASPLVRQLGVVSDVPSLMAAADVLLLSSLREGCPNVVLEALAAGVPVAATDVGDVRIVVGEEGVVVTPGDGRALGDAAFGLLRLGATERATLAFRARQRMRDSHLRGTVNTRIVSIYRTLLSIAKLR